MYGKIQITGKIEILTGMHIGSSSSYAPIGAAISPVIRDVITGLPIIPGSSLKGKIRTLLARQYNENFTAKWEEDVECIQRLFGNSKKGNMRIGRLIFSDMILENEKEFRDKGIQSITEVKFENSINRVTAVANPRQIERVIRGSRFSLSLIYNVEEKEEVKEDIEVLSNGFKLLQYDYLGGNGSRGYGKVKFQDLSTKLVIGELDQDILDACGKFLKEV